MDGNQKRFRQINVCACHTGIILQIGFGKCSIKSKKIVFDLRLTNTCKISSQSRYMPKPADSPIFRFLTQKENLAAVLEVTRYTEEIREYVAGRFWNRLEEAIKRNPNGKFSFS